MSLERSSDDQDPEPRRRLDPILIVFLALVAVGIVVVVVVSRSDVVVAAPDAGSAAALPPPPPTPDLVAKIDATPATTPKAKLMKEALKKRAQQQRHQRLARAQNGSGGGSHASSGGLNVIMTGDGQLRRAMASHLHGVHLVDDAEHGYVITLRAEAGGTGGGIYAKCSAAIAELPRHQLVASLSDRADAEAGAEREAADACASALADDVSAWLHAHR